MISLTTQDADFIANLARGEISNYQEAYEKNVKEMNEVFEKITKLHNEFSNATIDKEYEEVKKSYEDTVKDMKGALNEMLHNWQRVLELMMVGSNE